MRDVEDENIWIEEKMNVVTSEEYGSSLQEVNLLQKKSKTMRAEIDNHEPRIRSVCDNGQKLILSGHPDSETFKQNIQDLLENLGHLKEMIEARSALFNLLACKLSCMPTFIIKKFQYLQHIDIVRFWIVKCYIFCRNSKLLVSEKAQQFFFDANEAEAWMSEQVMNFKFNFQVLLFNSI
jgi:hypothetical protein